MRHDKDRALEPIEFIQMLKMVDDFYGQPFLLLDWQYQLLWDVYGTVNDEGYRQYRFAYLEIPKKNGKTTLIAGIALYHLICDGPGGQIYCCAADRQQAELVYKAACGMREQDPDLCKALKLTDSKKEIKNISTGTFLKVLSAEAYTKHGLNPTVVIFDELHAQPNRDLWDVMTFGAGAARKEPIWWVITTAGDDPDRKSIGWEKHEYARKVRDGEIEDPTWYVKIYGAPEDADIYDEKVWYAANPSLGKTISIENVRREALQARNDPANEKLFRWLRLNQWVSLKRHGWLPLTLYDQRVGKWTRTELLGKRCYAGLDLSSTTDLTALALCFPPQYGFTDWRVIYEAWIPEEKMKERSRRDKVPFDRWVEEEYVTATPGDCVDYEYIGARLVALNKLYNIKYLQVDPWNSRMLTQELMKNEAFTAQIMEVPQTMAGLSPPMKAIERLLLKGEMTHEANPCARWCFGNVVVAIDGNENKKPMKDKSYDRIDIIVAWIIAMHQATKEEEINVYEKRGMRVIKV